MSIDPVPELVLVHGWGNDGGAFAPLVAALGGRAACRAPDLPGHGARRGEPPPANVGALAREVGGWVREAPTDRRPRLLLGWSLGALGALEAVAARTCEVDALILVAGTACYTKRDGYEAAQEEVVLERLRRLVGRDRELAMTRFRSWVDAEIPTRVDELPERDVLEVTLDILARTDLRARLAGIAVPVLLVHGAADRVVPVASSRYLAERLQRATLRLFTGVGHVPFVSAPVECAEAVLSFASSVRAGSNWAGSAGGGR